MSRRTKKYEGKFGEYFGYYEPNLIIDESVPQEMVETVKRDYVFNHCLNKLGQLEDIEDELGIDLEVYHKLMSMLYCGDKNKLYVKDKNTIIEVGVLEIDYCKKKIIFYKDQNHNEDYIYGFWQYGKTWALERKKLL